MALEDELGCVLRVNNDDKSNWKYKNLEVFLTEKWGYVNKKHEPIQPTCKFWYVV